MPIQTNIKQDEGGFFLVTFPDISFAATDGESLKEALVEAEDCLEEAIAGFRQFSGSFRDVYDFMLYVV